MLCVMFIQARACEGLYARERLKLAREKNCKGDETPL